jgi:lincosamide nucleotidyltransferase A/C/D/E
VDASTVRRLVAQLEQAGFTVWLDGGWGIDALLGRETRPHHDLDIIVRVSDVPSLLQGCHSAEFVVREGSPPHAFVLVNPSGLELDVHAVTFHPNGTATHRMDNGNDWVFSADAFTGVGTVDGAKVSCLSPEAQVLCHAQGYGPTEKDFRDMELLEQAFEVQLPPLLQRRRPTHRDA